MLFLHVFSLMQHPSGGHIALYIATTAGFIALLMNQHIKATTMPVSSSLLVEKTQVMNVKQLYLFIFFILQDGNLSLSPLEGSGVPC